jgi:hypothetical protein
MEVPQEGTFSTLLFYLHDQYFKFQVDMFAEWGMEA